MWNKFSWYFYKIVFAILNTTRELRYWNFRHSTRSREHHASAKGGREELHVCILVCGKLGKRARARGLRTLDSRVCEFWLVFYFFILILQKYEFPWGFSLICRYTLRKIHWKFPREQILHFCTILRMKKNIVQTLIINTICTRVCNIALLIISNDWLVGGWQRNILKI